MKQTIINVLVGISVTCLIIFIYEKKIEILEMKNKEMELQNRSLYEKITMIEDSFDSFMRKGDFKRNKSNKNSITHSKKGKSSYQELITIKKDIIKLDNTLDSIKTTLPNRTGQDLINSLKLKTEI